MKAFGTRKTFQIFSVATLITGIIYFFFNYCYLSKRPQIEGNDIVKKVPKDKTKATIENGKIIKGIKEIDVCKEKEYETEPFLNSNVQISNDKEKLNDSETPQSNDVEEENMMKSVKTC